MKIILVGLPGKVAAAVAENIPAQFLHTHAVSSKRNAGTVWTANNGRADADPASIKLVTAQEIAATLSADNKDFVALDFSPLAIKHCALWEKLKIPCVIGGTAFDTDQLKKTVESSGCLAVLAPNLATHLVALQAILRMAASEFPDVFNGFDFHCTESHQQMKKDVSGTARSLLPTFQALGFATAQVENIKSLRNPEEQRAFGVPEEHLSGHAWHRYEAKLNGITLALEHRASGRAMYAQGALDACQFILERWQAGERARYFDMVDVLKGGK